MSATAKLIFCPFCGREAAEVCTDRDMQREFYYVFCGRCEASGPTTYDRDEVVQLWNTRHEEADYDY